MNKLLVGVLVVLLVGTLSVGYLLYRPVKTLQIVLSDVTLTVELAETPADQQKGLSGRDSMAADRGMLFVFDQEASWSFWMNGMRFPLDIIWFNSERRAVFILQDLQPCSAAACQLFTPSAKAMYVLEVNGGFVRAHNISLGNMFVFIR